MASTLERLLPAVGQVLGARYVVRSELNRGAFGVVYEATQTGLDELVTIKVLMPHVLTNEDMVRRFEREVLLAKGLRHPNTIRILDLGKTEEGLPYYVMEHVRGRALSWVLEREGCLSPAATHRVGIQVLRSLAEAHVHGIVHRDLKPSNLLVCAIPGTRDFVKVLDFGVAKAMASSEDEPTTHTGVVIGTPAYMSPEQARGARDVDARSDLYTVGLILAECLCGRRALDVSTLYDAITFHSRPDAAPLPESLFPSPLFPILERATRADPDERWPNADAMGRALEELTGLPETPDWTLLPPNPRRAQETPPTLPATPVPVSAGSLISGLHTPLPAKLDLPAHPAASQASGAHRWAPVAMAAVLFTAAAGLFVASEVPSSQGPEAAASLSTVASSKPPVPFSPPAEAPDEPAQPSPTDTASAAVAEARAALDAALPALVTVHVDGTPGARLSLGGRTVGELPFELAHPRLSAEVDVEVSRTGYLTEQAHVRLDTDHWLIELRHSARASSAREPANPPHERESRSPGLPFGRVPLYTGADSGD